MKRHGKGPDPSRPKSIDRRELNALEKARRKPRGEPSPTGLPKAPPFAELVAATNFSFLRGASHPQDMVARATMSCGRSEEDTSELQSLMRISSAVFCLKKKNITNN